MVLRKVSKLLCDKEPKPNEFTVAMGELIRKAREEAHISQADLAELICRRRATLTDLENGKHELDVTTLTLLAVALNKPILYFFPRTLTNFMYQDKLTIQEQELLIGFRQIQSEELKSVINHQVHALIKYTPTTSTEHSVNLDQTAEDSLD